MGKKISNNIKNFWFRIDVGGMACSRQNPKKKQNKKTEEASY